MSRIKFIQINLYSGTHPSRILWRLWRRKPVKIRTQDRNRRQTIIVNRTDCLGIKASLWHFLKFLYFLSWNILKDPCFWRPQLLLLDAGNSQTLWTAAESFSKQRWHSSLQCQHSTLCSNFYMSCIFKAHLIVLQNKTSFIHFWKAL